MYLEIEEEFKQQSLLRRSQIGFVVIFFVLTLSLGFFFWDFIDKHFLFCALSYAALFYIGAYIFIILKVHKLNEFSWKKVLFFDVIVNLYRNNIHDKDIKLLKRVLKNHNINTRPKQLEAIRHYQVLIPRNIILGSSFLSIFAIAISTIALVLDDKIYYNEGNLKLVFMILVTVALIYFVFDSLNKNIFKLFGNVELYKRLEASIAEFYMSN